MCFSPKRDGWKKAPWVVAFGVNFVFFHIVKIFNNEKEAYIMPTVCYGLLKIPYTH